MKAPGRENKRKGPGPGGCLVRCRDSKAALCPGGQGGGCRRGNQSRTGPAGLGSQPVPGPELVSQKWDPCCCVEDRRRGNREEAETPVKRLLR